PPPSPPPRFIETNVIGGMSISLTSIEEFPGVITTTVLGPKSDVLIRVRATDSMVNFSVPMYSKDWKPIEHWVTVPPEMFHAQAVSGFGGNRIAMYVLSSLI
ncbi:hypothetical protein VaNZ11_003406, partial [Volvox africanus]